MAVVQTQIDLMPPIRPTHIDPNTAAPVIGEVFFFKPDKITPKNVFILSGNPPSALPFIVAPNPVQLLADGGFAVNSVPVQIYQYLFDENDPTVTELYFVEVKRTDTSQVYAFENWPIQQIGSGSAIEETGQVNFLPSYGFDVRAFPDFFNAVNNQSADTEQVKPAWGWTWFRDNPTQTDWFYEFEALTPGTVLGDPAFEITLTAANLTGVQTINWFGTPIIADDNLVGKQFNFQFFARDKSAVAVTSLQIGIAVDGTFTPIVVGSISLSTSRTLNTVTFIMPDLSAQIPNPPLRVYLVVRLPLSAEFSIALTGMYLYEGATSTVTGGLAPPLLSWGETIARQFWAFTAESFASMLGTSQSFENMGLALSPGRGNLITRNSEGSIFIAGQGQLFNYAVPLDGRTLIENQPLQQTITNRFLDLPIAQLAGNAFVITNAVAAAFDINTRQPGPSYSTWVSNTLAVTIVDNAGAGGSFGLTAIAAVNVVTVTSVDMFNGNTAVNAMYQNIKPNFTALPPSPRILNNWVGTITQPPPILNQFPNSFSFAAGTLATANVIDGSGAAQFVATITFPGGGMSAAAITTKSENFPIGPVLNPSLTTIFSNYLSYLAASSGTMPVPPPHVIEFHVDGNGIDVPVQQSAVTVNFANADLASGSLMATATADAINAENNYTIDVVSTPLDQATLDISTSLTVKESAATA